MLDLGCKRFIIEKPVSGNKYEMYPFRKRCDEENVFVTVHHHWSYIPIKELIRNTENELNLGNPVGIRLLGGAIC